MQPDTTQPSLQARSPAELLELYFVTDDDLARIRTVGALVGEDVPRMVDAFYDWLPRMPEYERLFVSDRKVERVKQLQVDYWTDFLGATIDAGYLARRSRVGHVHATIGLSLQSYFAGMNMMLGLLVDAARDRGLPADEQAAAAASLAKLVHLDTSLVVDAFATLTNRTIAEQSEAIMAMSTPIATIWEGIMLLPVVGIIDSRRAQDVMSAILNHIKATEAKVCILDISGVAVVDTAVANHFIKMTKATRLMGCECIISGLSPAVTQIIVELGVDVGTISTRATLRDALAIAFARTGLSVGGRAA